MSEIKRFYSGKLCSWASVKVPETYETLGFHALGSNPSCPSGQWCNTILSPSSLFIFMDFGETSGHYSSVVEQYTANVFVAGAIPVSDAKNKGFLTFPFMFMGFGKVPKGELIIRHQTNGLLPMEVVSQHGLSTKKDDAFPSFPFHIHGLWEISVDHIIYGAAHAGLHMPTSPIHFLYHKSYSWTWRKFRTLVRQTK